MNFRSLFVAGTAALLMLAPHEASAGWTEFTDWAASFWAYGKASAQGEVMPPEVFAAEAPAAIERAGTRGFVTTEAKNLGEGTEIFTMTVANYKDETTGRPVILWLDKIDGSETFDLTGVAGGNLKPLQDVTLVIHRKDGSTQNVTVTLRVDSPIEVEYLKHGGILPYVLRELMSA